MMLYGLFLPDDWRTRFGFFAKPLLWAMETVPVINKTAHVSTIPDLIQGFYGLGVYIIPLYGLLMYICTGILHHASTRINPISYGPPLWKSLCGVYLAGCPVLIICLYMYYGLIRE